MRHGQIGSALRATAKWLDVDLAEVTRDGFRAARAAGVHDTPERQVRNAGGFARAKELALQDADRAIRASQDLHKTRAGLTATRRDLRASRDEVETLAQQLEFYAAASEPEPRRVDLEKPRTKGRQKRRGMPVFIWSDWHVEEYVDPHLIHGVNSYGLAEAERRIAKCVDLSIKMAEKCEQTWDYPAVCIAGLGDFMTGYIHEELEETNELSPLETVLWLRDRLYSAILRVKEEVNAERVFVVLKDGNHGRVHKRPRVKTRYKNSYEWALFKNLERDFEDDPDVEVIVIPGVHQVIDFFGHTLRFTHGDAIRFGGGVYGLGVPAAKAVKAWNAQIHADWTLMGHWHNLQWGDGWMSNGSLIGWSEYCDWIKASGDPRAQQGFFVLDAMEGPTARYNLWIQDRESVQPQIMRVR